MNRTSFSPVLPGLLIFGLAAAAAHAAAPLRPPTPRPKSAIQRGERSLLQRDLAKVKQVDTPFQNPSEAHAVNGRFELVLTPATFDSPGLARLEPTLPDRFELLSYNKERVGPTIRVKRGTKFRIHLRNDLQKGALDPGPNPKDNGSASEAIHGLCATNLHTHGLHVSPTGNSDNIFLVIEPQEARTFEYELLGNHPSGTFWYHPHKHGSVAYQLSNGASGALIVEGTPGDGIPDLDDVPEIAAASAPPHEKILVMEWYTYRISTDQVGRIDASAIYNVNPDQLESCPSIKLSGPAPSNTPNVLAINGRINPTIEIAPGEVQRWRIVHGGWDQVLDLSIVDANQNATTDLQFFEIAHDGLATGDMEAVSPLRIAPGQRSDVLIQAPVIPQGTTATYFIMSPDQQTAAFIATVKVTGNPVVGMKLPDRTQLKPFRPFPPIADNELVTPTVSNGTLEFAFKDPESDPKSVKPVFYTIDYRTFHQQRTEPIPLTLGKAQEWTITARVGDHPFHIHVNPFEVVSYTPACGSPVARDDWRDTLFVQAGESYTIRSRYQDFPGDSVLHCHILDHEDQGMMMQIRLIDPKRPPAPRKGVGLNPASTPAPALKLHDLAGQTRALADFQGQKVVLVFLQGLECRHCAAQLNELLGLARKSLADDFSIVAVSGRGVDPALAVRALGVTASDRFHLLVDEEHRAFRDFGCFDQTPQHGLFVIEKAGVIRFRYIGETPFDNAGQVVEDLRGLTPLSRAQAQSGPARPRAE
jgi:FtsP/CotA-like multicopper oxidase with cupredoxin domain/peroxiredoxin